MEKGKIKRKKSLIGDGPKEYVDRPFLLVVVGLLIFGLVVISSAGVAYSKLRFGDSYYFLKHQLLYGFFPGMILLYIVQKIDYSFWRKFSLPLFFLSLIFLVLVFVPGVGSNIYGASRWLKLGPFSFQPSEMLKLAVIIYLAAWLSGKREKVKDFFEGLIPFLIVILIIGFLLIRQPDMGTLGATIFIAIPMFFVSGARIVHLLWIGLGGIVAFALLVKLESYRMGRLLVFLDPELDPRGIGYQINQALLAIGSGGILGRGLGKSLQKFNYLPEPVGDSIFAIIGEELGMIGTVLVVGAFIFLAVRGLRIAKKAPDEFGKLMAVGIVSWIVFQAFINIAAISGIMPLTGIPLPFISYGGTSMVFLMVGVGILLNISKKVKNN